AELVELFSEWERWSAELLESHVSFPVLAYFRSQHDNQSWVAGLTTILDTCALVIAGMQGAPVAAARLTFAMARHAVVDLARVFSPEIAPGTARRLTAADLALLRERLEGDGVPLRAGDETDARLQELRAMYEPYAEALSRHLLMPLPAWVPPAGAPDNWQRLEE
nr:two pore domain potassium channel family protein [Acidobacteriota bacterium]